MTQEQKAEAYSKAVEKAKQEYNTTTSEDRKQWLEELFPELKESEDALTWLTRYIEEEAYYLSMDIRDYEDRIKLEKFKKSLAWLKKQGEQKPDYCHHEVDLSNCSEEYRKAYYDGWNNCNMQHSQCQSESNDVVKCLINGMKFYYEGNDEATWGTDKFSMKVKDILSWLERQPHVDMDKFANGVLSGVSNSIIQWLDANAAEGNMCLSNMECEALEDAVVNSNWSKVYGYMKKKLEKQGEKPQGKSALDSIKEERVDNANKVEPKFHKGDWVVDNCDYVWKIEGIINQFYILEGEEGGESRPTVEWVNKTFHLWTIEDAKDGDALVASDGSIFLFAGVVDCACKYYVALATDGYVKINKEAKGGYWETSRAVYPATKEQRDKLEKAMADAGYTLTLIRKN